MRAVGIVGIAWALGCAAPPAAVEAPRLDAAVSSAAPPRAAESEAASASPVASAAPAATSGPDALSPPVDAPVALEVPGHLPAVVFVPGDASAAAPRPLVVATHGAGGTPERHCAFWQRAVGGRAFVLCPRGRRLGMGDEPAFFYPDHHALAREVAAAVDALAARFGAAVDARAAVYAGFSQGATMGALALGELGDRFARAALVEGGFAEWSVATARAFQAAGGRRVLFGCGRPKCSEPARTSIRSLERGGVEARLVRDERTGHLLGGGLARAVREALPWLVEGDERWRSFDVSTAESDTLDR